MRKAHDKQNIADTQHAPDGKHHRHRHKGLAGAAADGGHCVGIGQQKEEQRNGPGLLCGKRDNVGRFAEKTGQLRHEGIHGKANELGENDRREDAEPGALFCPAIFARAEVLAGIGSERHGKASDRQERKAVESRSTASGSPSCAGCAWPPDTRRTITSRSRRAAPCRWAGSAVQNLHCYRQRKPK